MYRRSFPGNQTHFTFETWRSTVEYANKLKTTCKIDFTENSHDGFELLIPAFASTFQLDKVDQEVHATVVSYHEITIASLWKGKRRAVFHTN